MKKIFLKKTTLNENEYITKKNPIIKIIANIKQLTIILEKEFIKIKTDSEKKPDIKPVSKLLKETKDKKVLILTTPVMLEKTFFIIESLMKPNNILIPDIKKNKLTNKDRWPINIIK